MHRNDCVAMVLAGGQGSRLGLLTKSIAKPAVPFGGKYRIIDFVLSNCSNSGFYAVGVLTQYMPIVLNRYIGKGDAWDLDRKDGGVFVLPPYVRETGADWYRGTADAIYQNINFINMMNPSYVSILSGDHIYKMNYEEMLDYHKAKQADVTISVIEVPLEEASRFGIMNISENGRITNFQEKPANPVSNLASMGVYIFNWKALKKVLEEDNKDDTSSHDFGKNVIPKMLDGGYRMYAYQFRGYWKDVGEVESYWQSNMDLLDDKPELDLYDSTWPISSVSPTRPPHYVGPAGSVTRSIIGEGCTILGNVYNSVIFPGVHVSEGAHIENSIIMPYAQIEAHASIDKAIIGRRSIIGEGSRIGTIFTNEPQAITLIGEKSAIPTESTVTADGIIVQKRVG